MSFGERGLWWDFGLVWVLDPWVCGGQFLGKLTSFLGGCFRLGPKAIFLGLVDAIGVGGWSKKIINF